jgi:hypothetical protein
MRVLFDHGTPRGIKRFLTGHTVREAFQEGWHTISNGDLLTAAEQAGFDVLLTTDKNIRYQQNLSSRKIAIVVLERSRWPLVKPRVAEIAAAVDAATLGSYEEVEIPESH